MVVPAVWGIWSTDLSGDALEEDEVEEDGGVGEEFHCGGWEMTTMGFWAGIGLAWLEEMDYWKSDFCSTGYGHGYLYYMYL